MAEKLQKRSDILTSARALFKENGFHNTKMEDIAQRAGVGKGTLYEYFKNKQEIFDETCIEYVELILEKVEEISRMNISFNEKLLILFKKRKNSMYEDFEKSPIDYIMSYKNIISEKVVKRLFDHILDMNKIMIEIINQGKEEGVVRKDIPSEIIACFVVGTLGEYFNLKMYKQESEFNEEELIFNLLFKGFSVK
ncbi:MAG: transcriptional regulator, TetR family [Sedimentibacter sp.]|nr:transcriptional regulator, TetR family [Sedimentibacter sp.]